MIHTPPLTANCNTLSCKSLTSVQNSPIINCIFLVILILLLPTAASAQDKCSSVGNNPEWTSGLKQLSETMQANDWKTAKQQAKSLSLICPNAPVLNYMRGKIAEQLGDKQDALLYFQKASEGTYTFAVEPDTAKKIWYARYENEHPERTAEALELNTEAMSALEAENKRLKQDLEYEEKYFTNPKTMMWVGTGLGAGGLAIIGTGIALLLTSGSSDITPSPNGYKVDDNSMHATGWIATGLGAGLLITGAVLAGFYGYKYKKSISKNTDITLNFSPTEFHFNMTF